MANARTREERAMAEVRKGSKSSFMGINLAGLRFRIVITLPKWSPEEMLYSIIFTFAATAECIDTGNYVHTYCKVYTVRLASNTLANQKVEPEVTNMGRPPVPMHHKRDKRLVVMMTDNEMVALISAAQAADAASVSDWVRTVLLSAAAGADVRIRK